MGLLGAIEQVVGLLEAGGEDALAGEDPQGLGLLRVELQRRLGGGAIVLCVRLAQVRAMGVRLALDDFGTGYSCLGALTNYPFDQVKLDRQFVAALGRDRRAEAITRNVLQMVQALGMTSCAEGVETEEQLAFLDAHGCEEIQGYLIGRPIPRLPSRMATRMPLDPSWAVDAV